MAPLDKINQDRLLQVAGGSFGVFTAHSILAPGNFQDFHMSDKPGRCDKMTRWGGLFLGLAALQTLSASRKSASKETKRDTLLAIGAVGTVGTGMHVWSWAKGEANKYTIGPQTLLVGTTSALCLAKGLAKSPSS